MNAETTLPPKISRIYQDSYRLWLFALVTPIIYLLIGRLLAHWDVVEPRTMESLGERLGPVEPVILAVTAGVVASVGLMRWRRQRAAQIQRDRPSEAIDSWRRHFFMMGAYSDLLGMLGLVFYIATGETLALLAGGLLAYVAYAISYPMRSELRGLNDPQEPEE